MASYLRDSIPHRTAERHVAVRGSSLDLECADLRFVVLATRCWRPQSQRTPRRTRGRSFSVPSNDAGQRIQTEDGRRHMESRLCRLLVSCLHNKYCVLADRYARPFTMGEAHDDGAVIDFACHSRRFGGQSGEHSVISPCMRMRKRSVAAELGWNLRNADQVPLALTEGSQWKPRAIHPRT